MESMIKMTDLIQIDHLNKPSTELVELTKEDYIKLCHKMNQQLENREYLDNILETRKRLDKPKKQYCPICGKFVRRLFNEQNKDLNIKRHIERYHK